MSQLSIEKKRNVALVGQPGSGKTSLVESILFEKGIVQRPGRTQEGNTFSDFTDEEKARGTSIYATLIRLDHRGHGINLLDCPGYADFIGETKSALRVADAVIGVANATSGAEVELLKIWRIFDEYDLPVILFVNQLDKERSSFANVLAEIGKRVKVPLVPFQIPLGADASFSGVVDLVKMKVLRFDDKGKWKEESGIPPEVADLVAEYREKLIECAAEQDEALMEKYFAEGTLSEQEILDSLKKGVVARSFVPVLCGSALKHVGTALVLDAIVDFLPSPARHAEVKTKKIDSNEEVTVKASADEPFRALVFKTSIDPYSGKLSFFRVYSGTLTPDQGVYNLQQRKQEKPTHVLEVSGKTHKQVSQATPGDICALAKLDATHTGDTLTVPGQDLIIPPTEFPKPTMQMAVITASKDDDEKLGNSIGRLTEGDVTLSIRRDPETHQTLLIGMGEQQLDVAMARLKNQFHVNAELKTPRVGYKETITRSGEGSHRHKKQSGGHGQFGEVHLRLKPLARGEGFKFTDAIVGGVVPGKFIPSVEKGIKERLMQGIQAGCPVVDVEAELFYGKDHAVDSSDMAFKMAGSKCFQTVAKTCGPILLEPIMMVTIRVPKQYMGEVISDLNTKRGRVMGMDSDGDDQIIQAQAPLAEMYRYAVDLRSITRSWGTFDMEFSQYEPVPKEVADKVIAAVNKVEEEE